MELFHSAYTSGLHSVDNCVFGRSALQYTAEMSGVGVAAPAVAWAELVTLAAAVIEAVAASVLAFASAFSEVKALELFVNLFHAI